MMLRVGLCMALFAAVLFHPWLEYRVSSLWWRPVGPVEHATRIVQPGDNTEMHAGQPDPPVTNPQTHASACPQCWNVDCRDTHFGPDYPVKPPWVPLWVIEWTLLVHVVPDHSGQCP